MTDRPPLGAREFEILVTLVAGPKHGYAIMRELREQGTGGRVLGPGTLYRLLKELVQRGWITAVTAASGGSEGPPRRVYRLTALGQRMVSAEAERLAALVERARPLLNGPSRTPRFEPGPQ
jgi:DNA-binding PadR family transcriptional regulator